MSMATPSIVPAGHDQNVYLVVNSFGERGPSFVETDIHRTDFENTISDLISGEHSDPLRVVMFNTSEDRAADVSAHVADEILRRVSLAGDVVPRCLENFIDLHYGPERQLTLRLAGL
ncbi:hypothetical protein ABIF78_007776 [Bradyrhizobium japonicum]